MKTLLILKSIHHKNTEKIAKVFAEVLDAEILGPRQIDPNKFQKYDLIGFGSGIYSDKHHKSILNLADKLPQVTNNKAFIFSTSGAPGKFTEEFLKYTTECHLILKEKLQSKGYTIVDEFSCPGFNTNKFLKLVGGLNKRRPNIEDLKHAEQFALNLKEKISILT
ncbi:MAG: flavodoxin family protein [Candidatus Hodarchaeales archaeon]|jgi:flavodoxin